MQSQYLAITEGCIMHIISCDMDTNDISVMHALSPSVMHALSPRAYIDTHIAIRQITSACMLQLILM